MLDNGPSNGLKVARKLIWQWKHMVFLKRWSDMLDDGPTNGLIESGQKVDMANGSDIEENYLTLKETQSHQWIVETHVQMTIQVFKSPKILML